MKSESHPIGKIRQRLTHFIYLVVASFLNESNYGFELTTVFTLDHMIYYPASATVSTYLDVAQRLSSSLTMQTNSSQTE